MILSPSAFTVLAYEFHISHCVSAKGDWLLVFHCNGLCHFCSRRLKLWNWEGWDAPVFRKRPCHSLACRITRMYSEKDSTTVRLKLSSESFEHFQHLCRMFQPHGFHFITCDIYDLVMNRKRVLCNLETVPAHWFILGGLKVVLTADIVVNLQQSSNITEWALLCHRVAADMVDYWIMIQNLFVAKSTDKYMYEEFQRRVALQWCSFIAE